MRTGADPSVSHYDDARLRMVTRVRGFGIVCLTLVCVLTGLAASASAATTCKTVTEVVHVHRTDSVWRIVRGRRVRVHVRSTVAIKKHVRVCESANLSMTTTSVPSSGGSVTINYAATNATKCTLSATPAFWTGSNPISVNCRDSYRFTVSAATAGRHWTFRFTAKNRYGQVVSSAGTLTQQAPPPPPPRPPVRTVRQRQLVGLGR